MKDSKYKIKGALSNPIWAAVSGGLFGYYTTRAVQYFIEGDSMGWFYTALSVLMAATILVYVWYARLIPYIAIMDFVQGVNDSKDYEQDLQRYESVLVEIKRFPWSKR